VASQGIAEMLASGEASAAGVLRGVNVSEARWDGSCPAGSSEGTTVPSRSISRGPGARRPTAFSNSGSSAILAPRCQAAGGGERLVISSLGDFGGFIHGTLNTVIPCNTIIGGILVA